VTDFEAEGLLEDLEDESARAARVELLRELEAEGYELAELRRAVEEGRLALLPVERALTGEARYTADEVAELSGLDREFLDALWRALGMALSDPSDRVYTESDLEAARSVKAFRDAGMPDDGILEATRVMSRSMANVAAAIGGVFSEAFLQPGDTERELGRRYAQASRALLPHLGQTILHVLNIQQRELVRRVAVDEAMLASGRSLGAQPIGVCFADLVGFTRLGENVPVEEVGEIAGQLGVLAGDVAEPPVRLVKTIGDAAMLVSPEVDALLEAALTLVEAADAVGEEFPQLKAGVAFGEALGRAGDWYGRPVNLASRVTAIARPGSVLAAEEAREAAAQEWRWSFARRRRLKGIPYEVSLFRVRRADAGDAAS
jgi:adenylate cyclase